MWTGGKRRAREAAGVKALFGFSKDHGCCQTAAQLGLCVIQRCWHGCGSGSRVKRREGSPSGGKAERCRVPAPGLGHRQQLQGCLPPWELLPLSAGVLGWSFKNILLLNGGSDHLVDAFLP